MSVLLAIYNPATGDIRRKVACSESQVEGQVRPGEAALEIPRGTIFNDLSHRVDLTELVLVEK